MFMDLGDWKLHDAGRNIFVTMSLPNVNSREQFAHFVPNERFVSVEPYVHHSTSYVLDTT